MGRGKRAAGGPVTSPGYENLDRTSAVRNNADVSAGDSVLLGQLFACTEQGGVLVAEATDSRLVHIDGVPSGLACNCVCPGCGRQMVAKKGSVQARHFAHYAQQDGQTCVSAGETALHKFAKRVLNDRLQIALPAMIVKGQGDQEIVVQAERRTFDRAILEKKEGQIVPDVVLLLRDRRLLVEFKVTHACGEEKIARIREMDVGAIEIDLSKYRDHRLNEIGDQILYDAPRIWLHNPREREAREKLEDRARGRAEEKRKQVDRLSGLYRHRTPSPKSGNGACEMAIKQDGLGDFINLPIEGAGCFTVPVAEWQAAVLLRLISADDKVFRTRNGMATLRQRGWVDQTFADISDELASAVKETGVPFNSPAKAVEAYLQQLERRGLVISGSTETWRISEILRRRIEEARELRERPHKRKSDMCDLVGDVLSRIPQEEMASFIFESWWKRVLPGRGYSAFEAAQFNEGDWQTFRRELVNIPTQIRFSPRETLDLMGLPYQGVLGRAIEQKRLEEQERERAKQAKLEADRIARVANLRDRASKLIGSETEVWISTSNVGTGGRSPLDAAASGETGYEDALRALDTRVEEITAQRRAAERKARAVAALEAVAYSRYYDPNRAALWMRSKRRELGGKSPEDFTTDDATRQRCVDLLPPKRSHR